MKSWLCLVLLALGLVPAPSLAIPAFARKYGVNCTMCHTAFPRLSDFGVRFSMNGYQLPGREDEEKTVLESPPPFSARASGGVDSFSRTGAGAPEEVNRFRLNTLDVLSAGVLGRHRGYLVVYRPPIPAALGFAGQDASLEMATAVFRHLGTSWVNLRVGRFEAAYTAFSVARQLSVAPYEVYAFSFPGGSPIAETPVGIELYGWSARSHLRYAAGWVNGAGTNPSGRPPMDAYGRVAYVFGEGEGQTAGQRVGITGYVGFAPAQASPGGRRFLYARVGIDASLNWRQLNLALEGVVEQDAAELWAATAPGVTTLGGFAELSWFPSVKWAVFARADGVAVPAETGQGNIYRGTAGARFYPVDNVAMHLEVTLRSQAATLERLGTARIDYAF